MKTLTIDKITAELPDKFSELHPRQLLNIGQVFAMDLPRPKARVWLVRCWAGKLYMYNENLGKLLKQLIKSSIKKKLSPAHIQSLHDQLFETDCNRHHMAMLTDWFDNDHVSDKWLVPHMYVRQWLIFPHAQAGPSFRFGNLQFWEWCQAEMYFSRYARTNNRDDFNKFLACIYHPLKGGQRIPFSDANLQQRAKAFNSVSPAVCYAIQLNYIAVKRWLAMQYKYVFKSAEGNDVAKTDYAELLLRSAAQQHIDEDIVARKPLLTELKKLDMMGKDAEEMQQKQGGNA